jgi:hypothetical protein
VSVSGSVRRRQAGISSSAPSSLRPSRGCAPPATPPAPCATPPRRSAALDDEPSTSSSPTASRPASTPPAAARALREHPRVEEAWLLAITPAGPADAGLRAGADDYLHRPFTRGELLARRAPACAPRASAPTTRSSARCSSTSRRDLPLGWHADHTLELISDEIERISGYRRELHRQPAADADGASSTRTTASGLRGRRDASHEQPSCRVPDPARRRRGPLGARPRPARPRAGGRLWMDGAIFDITDRRAAEEALRQREIEQRPHGGAARLARADRGGRRRARRRGSSATCTTARSSASSSIALEVRLGPRASARPERPPAVPRAPRPGARRGLVRAARAGPRIHPAVLTDRGLAAAVSALASRAPVPVEILELPADRLASSTEATAYFTVSEALTNIAKYAEATHATIRWPGDGRPARGRGPRRRRRRRGTPTAARA